MPVGLLLQQISLCDMPHHYHIGGGGGGGGALFFNFVYAHSGADRILMIVASKFSVYAEHHYCICNEYFACFVDCSNIDTVNTAVLFRSYCSLI